MIDMLVKNIYTFTVCFLSIKREVLAKLYKVEIDSYVP